MPLAEGAAENTEGKTGDGPGVINNEMLFFNLPRLIEPKVLRNWHKSV